MIDATGKSPIDIARLNFPESLQWMEHPESMNQLEPLEATITGNISL